MKHFDQLIALCGMIIMEQYSDFPVLEKYQSNNGIFETRDRVLELSEQIEIAVDGMNMEKFHEVDLLSWDFDTVPAIVKLVSKYYPVGSWGMLTPTHIKKIIDLILAKKESFVACGESISEDKWMEAFKPTLNAEGDSFHRYETYGDELAFVQSTIPSHVWTELDCDGELVISSGYHHVNRMNYIICDVPFSLDEIINVVDE